MTSPADRRSRIRAGLEVIGALHSGNLAVLGKADFEVCGHAGGGTGGAEDLFPAQLHLDRAAGFLGKHHRDGLQEDNGLAAEAAADFGGDRLDVAGRHAGNQRCHVANHELALAAAPDGGLGVWLVADAAGLRFDVTLVHRCGLEGALDDDVSGGKAGFDVAGLHRQDVGDVRGALDAFRADPVVQDRCTRLHRLVHIDDVRQHLVIDLDQVAATAATGWPA